jgi:predicted aspartyl protease
MPSIDCGFSDIVGGATGSQLLITQGPTVLVDIGFDAAFKVGMGLPTPGISAVKALVDTGATESHIDSLLASQLGLPVVDQRTICGSGGAHKVNIHLAQVHVPSLSFTIYGEFAAVDLAAGGQMHQALLGRTFLRSMTMSYDGRTGKVTIVR